VRVDACLDARVEVGPIGEILIDSGVPLPRPFDAGTQTTLDVNQENEIAKYREESGTDGTRPTARLRS